MSFWKKIASSLALCLLVICNGSTVATALQSSSATYGIDQAQFGNGGELDACSTTYCSKQTAGETAVGNSASSSYQTQAGGLVTDRQESLQLIVNGTNTDIGTLTTTSTATTTATFSVKSYLASGYAVYTSSPGPQNNGYTMHGMTTAAASSQGTEQFGINLVNNTLGGTCNAPANFGHAATQIPDGSFSYGQAAPGYDTCGLFKYKDGDAIAQSATSSGETDYTISYMFNISALTPGGDYKLQQSIVATSTF